MLAVKEKIRLFRLIWNLPRLAINLRFDKIHCDDEFSRRITSKFFREANRRHPKFPLVRRSEYGVTVCRLGSDFESYWRMIEPAARRNCKKATRLGYTFGPIHFNDHLDEIRQILQSAKTRQGRSVPDRLIREGSRPKDDPPSRSPMHSYPYFGITRDGRLYAYAGCLIAGELCEIQSLYGHADYQPDGIVPLLITSIAEYLIREYSDVRCYSFGNYFGANETMRRFKRKFGFQPHKVTWKLGK